VYHRPKNKWSGAHEQFYIRLRLAVFSSTPSRRRPESARAQAEGYDVALKRLTVFSKPDNRDTRPSQFEERAICSPVSIERIILRKYSSRFWVFVRGQIPGNGSNANYGMVDDWQGSGLTADQWRRSEKVWLPMAIRTPLLFHYDPMVKKKTSTFHFSMEKRNVEATRPSSQALSGDQRFAQKYQDQSSVLGVSAQ